MADNNIQMGQRNAENTAWNNHYPITKAENVITSGGNVAIDLAAKADKTEINTLATAKADIIYVDTLAASLASGSPAGTFATLAALQADTTANTTDGKKRIYLVTADGKWYYWDGVAWAAGGVYQSTGLADKSVTAAKLADDVMLNSPFVTYDANLVGILDIKIYSTSYQKFGLRYFWRNSNGFTAYVRIEGWDGGKWVNLDSYSSTTAPAADIEVLSVDSAFLKADILIDWRLVPDPLILNAVTPIEIKKSCIFYETQTDISVLNTAKSLLPTDGYAVKDSITNIITVDTLGNGDFTTIADAYASITDSSIYNQYEIMIYPGTYNEIDLKPPAYTHTHGIKPNTVIVTSEGLGGTLPVFDQQYGSSKLSNMKIISDTGYCIHFDVGLDTKTLVNENLHLVKTTYGAIIGGGTFKKGTLYLWRSCIFENGSAVCHSNGNAQNFDNTRIIFDNCKLVNAYIGINSVGGFGHCVCEINGLYTQQGQVSLISNNSSLRNVDSPNTYFANNVEWQFIGGNNVNFLPNIVATGEGLEFETVDIGDSLTISGTAVKDLFGIVTYKKGGARLKGRAIGLYMVKDTKAGQEPYSTPADVYQMWKRLGDCSTTNKTLSVTVDGVTQTYTFNADYATLKTPEADIISAVNAVITNAILKKNVVTEAWENVNTTEKQFVTVIDVCDILKTEWVTAEGLKCSAESCPEDVYGIALESGACGEQIQVWIGNVFKITAADGEYGIGADGKLSAQVSTKIGKIKDNVFYRY